LFRGGGDDESGEKGVSCDGAEGPGEGRSFPRWVEGAEYGGRAIKEVFADQSLI